MNGLHLVRIPLDARALDAFAIAERVDDDDRGYAMHLALRRRFGSAAPQPFRYFEGARAGPHLLGYVADVPALLDAAALPPIDGRLDAVFPGPPSARPMPSTWRRDARYAFETRVHPVVRYGPLARAARRADGKRGAGERDPFLAALERAEGNDVTREEVYADWLVRQMAGAARIERASIDRMRRLAMRRSPHGRPGSSRIEGYEAVFVGTLLVEEPDRFERLLSRGVGRQAAFGFGMLALAPPRPG